MKLHSLTFTTSQEQKQDKNLSNPHFDVYNVRHFSQDCISETNKQKKERQKTQKKSNSHE